MICPESFRPWGSWDIHHIPFSSTANAKMPRTVQRVLVMVEASSFPLALVPGHSSDAALVHMAAVSVRRLEPDLSAAHQISYEF